MKRLVIHIGLHKTGTTALQQYLAANDAKLRQRNVAYIALDRMRKEVIPLFDQAEDRNRDAVKRLISEIPDAASSCLTRTSRAGSMTVRQGGFMKINPAMSLEIGSS